MRDFSFILLRAVHSIVLDSFPLLEQFYFESKILLHILSVSLGTKHLDLMRPALVTARNAV